MKKIKLEHIDNLRRGKKSGANIGSRGVSHHLYSYEETKYKQAMKNKYLEVTTKDRVNLENIWQKICIVKPWKNYVLKKDPTTGISEILLSDVILYSGETKEMKAKIKTLV